MTKPYLKFLAAQTAERTRLELSAKQVALLNYVLQETATGRVLRVQDLITLSEIASQATLHAALKGLVKKGLISVKSAREDARVKKVSLSAKGAKYFERLEAAMSIK